MNHKNQRLEKIRLSMDQTPIDQPQVVKYQFITDPFYPEIVPIYQRLKLFLQEAQIISQNKKYINRGLVQYQYHIIYPEETVGYHSNLRTQIDQHISDLKYVPLIYSCPWNSSSQNIPSFQKIIHYLLEKLFAVNIDHLEVHYFEDTLSFTPTYQGEKIYVYKSTVSLMSPNSSSNQDSSNAIIDHKALIGKIMISDDPLIPYVVNEIYPHDDPQIYSSSNRVFLIDYSDETREKVDLILDSLENMKEDGYLSLPSSNRNFNRQDLKVGVELLLNLGGSIKKLNPIVVGQVHHRFNHQSWIEESIDQIQSDKFPLFSFSPPDNWILYAKNYDTNYLLHPTLHYLSLLSYLETIEKNPSLRNSLDSLQVNSVLDLSCRFPDLSMFEFFYKRLDLMIERCITTDNKCIEHKRFDDYSRAIGFRWKVLSILGDSSPLIIEYEDDYWVFYQKMNSVEAIPFSTEDLDQITHNYQAHLSSFYLNKNTLNHVGSLAISTISGDTKDQENQTTQSTQGMDLYQLVRLFPMEKSDKIDNGYVLVDVSDLEMEGDEYLNPGTQETTIYYYSYEAKYFKEMINGCIDLPTKYVKGIINPDTIFVKFPEITIGKILMSKYEMADGVEMYSFEVGLSAENFYGLPQLDGKIRRNQVEEALLLNYRPDLVDNYTILPSQDPGYIIPIFDMMVTKNMYSDEQLYLEVKNMWKSGACMTEWSKYLYEKEGKISWNLIKKNVSKIFDRFSKNDYLFIES